MAAFNFEGSERKCVDSPLPRVQLFEPMHYSESLPPITPDDAGSDMKRLASDKALVKIHQEADTFCLSSDSLCVAQPLTFPNRGEPKACKPHAPQRQVSIVIPRPIKYVRFETETGEHKWPFDDDDDDDDDVDGDTVLTGKKNPSAELHSLPIYEEQVAPPVVKDTRHAVITVNHWGDGQSQNSLAGDRDPKFRDDASQEVFDGAEVYEGTLTFENNKIAETQKHREFLVGSPITTFPWECIDSTNSTNDNYHPRRMRDVSRCPRPLPYQGFRFMRADLPAAMEEDNPHSLLYEGNFTSHSTFHNLATSSGSTTANTVGRRDLNVTASEQNQSGARIPSQRTIVDGKEFLTHEKTPAPKVTLVSSEEFLEHWEREGIKVSSIHQKVGNKHGFIRKIFGSDRSDLETGHPLTQAGLEQVVPPTHKLNGFRRVLPDFYLHRRARGPTGDFQVKLRRTKTLNWHGSLVESDNSQDSWHFGSSKLDIQHQDAFRGVSCDIVRGNKNLALPGDKQTLEAQRNRKISGLLGKLKRKN